MNILMISTFPPRRCGIGDYTSDLVSEISKDPGTRVGVLTYQERDGPETDNSFEIWRDLDTRATESQVAPLIDEFDADIVHLQSSTFLHRPSISAAVADACTVPLVTTVHDAPSSFRLFYAIPSLRKVYRKSARMFVHSPGVFTTLTSFHHIEADRIVSLPLGVNTDRFHPGADGSECRQRYGLEGKRIVLFFGFLRPGKGLESLILAWGRIEHRYPDALLAIAGGSPSQVRRYRLLLSNEAGYPSQIRRLAHRLGIEERIVFTDYVPEELVPGLLATSEMAVFPYQGSPTQSSALHKALSCGMPVISTRVPESRDFLEDGRTAILVPQGDVEALTESLDLLLSDHTASRNLGRQARMMAEQELDLSAVAAKTLAEYHRILELNTPS